MDRARQLPDGRLATDAAAFSGHLKQASQTARKVFARYPGHALDEQAGPAYLEGLALSRWIFWRRLKAVYRHLPDAGEVCLDFGCGLGLLLPFLNRRFERVLGVDLMPEPARQFLTQWEQDHAEPTSNVQIVSELHRAQLPDAAVDVVLALDVLEHVEGLPQLLESFARLLKPQGLLLVSGPTENWLYKLGRRIVGFSGHYHVRNVHDIADEMHRNFDVQLVNRIGFPMSLFHVLKATPRAESVRAETTGERGASAP